MATDLSKLLKLWKGPKSQLPEDGPVEKLFFVLDTPVIEIYQGAGVGLPLRRISNLIYTNPEITALDDIENPVTQVIYVVKKDGSYLLGTYDGAAWVTLLDTSTAVTPDNTVTFTNKTIDADSNVISNLEADNFKAGVILSAGDNIVSSDAIGSASDSKIISEKAFVEYIKKQFEDRINGMEFMGVKTVIELQALQSGEIGNYYIVADAGTLAEVALVKDDRILITKNFEGRNIVKDDFYLIASADLTKVLTPDGTQTVTNKIIDAANNTITNIGYDDLDPAILLTDIIGGETNDITLPTSAAVKKALESFAILWEDGNVAAP